MTEAEPAMAPIETAEPSAQGSATPSQTAEFIETAQQSAPENEGIGKKIPLEAEFSNELAGQRNEHENAANRLTVIDRSHLKGTELRVFLHTVQHGSLHGKAAVFVALEFNFIFREDSFRFTSAEILTKWHKRTALAPQPDPKPSRNIKTKSPAPRPLEVISHSPVKIYGNPTREDRKWTFGIAVPVSATVGIASVGVQPSAGLESAFPRDHRLTISGFRVRGGARWDIHENSAQASGIPNKFTCAMLVPYGSDNAADDTSGCQAAVSVAIKTSWPGVSLRGMPWNADDPLLFIPGNNLGNALSITEFERLTEADWKSVVEYPTEFQVSLSMEAQNCCHTDHSQGYLRINKAIGSRPVVAELEILMGTAEL